MGKYLDKKPAKKNEDGTETSNEYSWNKPVDECVADLEGYIQSYYSEMNRTGRINLYRNSYYKYFQGFIMKGMLSHGGSEGELTNTFVNHYANLITHMVNMVCQQKLSYEPQVTVNDSQAQDQIKLAKGVLNLYTVRPDMDLDGVLRKATEMSLVFDASFVSAMWNKDKGRTIAADFDESNGQPTGTDLKEGDAEYGVYTPFDVILDTSLPEYASRKWIILRKWENKYDIAARYPKWKESVVELSPGTSLGDTQLSVSVDTDSDIIPVYYAFHEKSLAVKDGRMVIFIDAEIILADGKLRYREIPLYRMAARDLWGSPFGYSRAFDLLPGQEAIDRLCSAVLTNQLTFATQNILIPKGSSIAWENLYGGLNVIEWDASMGEAGKPSALQLTSSPQEVFTSIKDTITNMGTLAGVNEVVRGNPDLALKGQISGASLALMTSNSIQFNSDLNKAYVRLAEQVGTATVHLIQDFAFPDMGKDEMGNQRSLKRSGMSVSATQKFYKKDFTKNDIDKVDKIAVRYGNPLAQTTSGRMQIAETLMQNHMIDAKQYLGVIETGSLEPAYEHAEAQMHLIKEENEALYRGEPVTALWADDHQTHIAEHLSLLSNLDARRNDKIVNAVREHVQQHQKLLPPPPPLPPAGPGGPQTPAPHAPTPPPAHGQPGASSPANVNAQMPGMPKMPLPPQ
jgi:hypothetical protein